MNAAALWAEDGKEAPRMNPWNAQLSPLERRRLGKTMEELGELQAVIGRMLIQGIDEVDPGTGKTNRQRFIDETADVMAQIECNLDAFHMPSAEVMARKWRKVKQMDEWEAHFHSPCGRCGGTGVVPDGEITGEGGVEFQCGPIKCVKDCPACGGAK